jgi:hypothetical protein
MGVGNNASKAGKVLRVALYRAASTDDIYPVTRIVTGDIPLDAMGWQQAGTVATLTGGYVYWLAISTNGTALNLNINDYRSWWACLGVAASDDANSNPQYTGFRIVQAFAAMPATWPVTTFAEYNGVNALAHLPTIGMRFSA